MIQVNVIFSLLLTYQVYLTAGIEVYEPDPDIGTESETLALISTTQLPFTATDNGMTLGEIPDPLPSEDTLTELQLKDDLTALHNLNLTVPSYAALELPDNHHKNYTGSPYAASIELPPLLNNFNAYQEQYKAYYKQKSEYEYKPVKFEENSAKNHYVAYGLGSYLDDNEARHKYEELKHNREPFPYSYERERLPLLGQSPWVGQNEIGDFDYRRPHKPEGYVASKDEEKGLYGWKKALKFFTALVPLGLLLATFTPTVISINSTTDQKPTRQRSLTGGGLNLTGDDFREFLRQKYGVNATEDPECESRVICELSRLGREETGSYVQRSFWYLANETPDDIAQQLGVRDLFRAIRTGDCNTYKCRRRRKAAAAAAAVKKGVRRASGRVEGATG